MHSSIPYQSSQSHRSLSRIWISNSRSARRRKCESPSSCTKIQNAVMRSHKYLSLSVFPQSNASILRISFLPVAKSYSKFECCCEILRKYETRDAWNSNTRLFCLSFFLIQQPIIHCTSESRNLRLLRPS